MKKILSFLFIYSQILWGQISLTGEANYKLVVNGYQGRDRKACGDIYGLRGVYVYYENGQKEIIWNGRIWDQNFSYNKSYTKNKKITGVQFYSINRWKTWIGCNGGPKESYSSILPVYGICSKQTHNNPVHVTTGVTIQSLPEYIIDFNSNVQYLLDHDKNLSISLTENMESSSYNWKYSIDGVVKDFKAEYNYKPAIAIKASDFVSKRDYGKIISVWVESLCKVDGVAQKSNIFKFKVVKPPKPILPSLPKFASEDENYIHSRVYLEPTKVTSLSVKQIEGINYYDGLGRPKQNIVIKGSPTEKDIVTPIEYDAFGRRAKDYLPIPQSSTQKGRIYLNPLSNTSQTYGSEKIYSEKIIENSPLDRLLGTIQVGNDWQNKPTNIDYDANSTSDGVKKYSTTTSWSNGATYSTLSLLGNYGESQLYKNSTTDEDGNSVIEFKNGQGQVLLLRRLNGTEKIDTYYVYNEYNQLAFVLPPLLSSKTSVFTSDLDLLGYQYRYDGKGRLVEKKLPGKDWEYMVYDQQNRLVMTQDGNLRAKNQWFFTKYDIFNRIAFTGLSSGGSRSNEQNQINTDAKKYNNVERKNAIGLTKNNLGIYYADASTGETYPINVQSLLSVNYYDTYPTDRDIPVLPQEILEQVTLKPTINNGVSTKSLPLASFVKNIENDNWTKTYTYYDEKGRVIGSYTQNHLGGYTKIESKLDFAGVTQESWIYHKGKPGDRETIIKERFTYDHQNRMLEHYHQVNTQAEELLVKNNYDELGRVAIKEVGGSKNSPLQSVNYQYNIRGWLSKVNEPNQLGDDLFAFELKYNNPEGNQVLPKYNGNISQMDWLSSQDQTYRRYSYQYDSLDRLNKAFYAKPKSTVAHTSAYDEYLSYDMNGNITQLSRFGEMDRDQALKIDELRYTYQGNQLVQVQDHSRNQSGYPIGGNIITYNGNGNMISHLDKGISSIAYNHLNLPNSIVQSSGTTNYIYRADGAKQRKTYNNTTTDYLDGFQYVNGELEFVPTTEGYYDFKKNRYVYQYKDQVNNIRLSYYRGINGEPTIDQETNYYPFGLEHKGYNRIVSTQPNYKYGFQKQERQDETGWLSFKWRNYDPALARFFNIDPLSEKYNYQSHYNFSENRVVDGIELEGLEFVPVHGTNAKREDTKLYSVITANYQGGSTWERSFVERVADITGWDYKSTYEYSWSGENSVNARKIAGKRLAEWIMSDVNPYKDLKHVTFMGHSHGGNVNKIAKNILEKNGWKVDIINIATPQRKDFQSNKKGNGLYINFYNNTDIIQVAGKIGDGSGDASGRYTNSHTKSRIDNKASVNREIGFKSGWLKMFGGHSYHRDTSAQKQMIDIINREVKKKENEEY